MTKKKVRMLLHSDSDPKLDKEDNLAIQRKILTEYVEKNPDWIMDSKEYLAANSINEKEKPGTIMEVSSEAEKDAEHDEYDILVCLKMEEIGSISFMVSLIVHGIKIYTVREGLCDPFDDSYFKKNHF